MKRKEEREKKRKGGLKSKKVKREGSANGEGAQIQCGKGDTRGKSRDQREGLRGKERA